MGPPKPEAPESALARARSRPCRNGNQIAALIIQIAPRYGVDPRLALAVVAVESNFDALAVSPKDARGLMQLIPETAARYKVRYPLNPRQNLHGGLAYLRFLLAYYRGQVTLAAAAYNAGEAAVDRHGACRPTRKRRRMCEGCGRSIAASTIHMTRAKRSRRQWSASSLSRQASAPWPSGTGRL